MSATDPVIVTAVDANAMLASDAPVDMMPWANWLPA